MDKDENDSVKKVDLMTLQIFGMTKKPAIISKGSRGSRRTRVYTSGQKFFQPFPKSRTKETKDHHLVHLDPRTYIVVDSLVDK